MKKLKRKRKQSSRKSRIQALRYFELGNKNSGEQHWREANKYYQLANKNGMLNAPLYNNLGVAQNNLGATENALKSLFKAIELDPQSSRAYFNLGIVYHAKRNFTKAQSAYRKAVKINPNYYEAWVNIGNLLHFLGDCNCAKEAYEQAARIKNNDDSVAYLLDAMNGNSRDRTPDSLVRRLFDEYSITYEDHVVKKLGYQTPSVLRKEFEEFIPDNRKFDHMLDMGCGTGIAGSVFRNICHSMTGVDISTKMIQVSSQKNIYDRLIGQGIPQYLDETTEKYDLFVATDVLIYFGELGQIFSAVKNRRLREETYFIFSVEHLEEGNYKLNPSGRFSHSVQYIHNIANRIGWKILYDECVPLRMNKGQQVIGRHIIMR